MHLRTEEKGSARTAPREVIVRASAELRLCASERVKSQEWDARLRTARARQQQQQQQCRSVPSTPRLPWRRGRGALMERSCGPRVERGLRGLDSHIMEAPVTPTADSHLRRPRRPGHAPPSSDAAPQQPAVCLPPTGSFFIRYILWNKDGETCGTLRVHRSC